MESDVESVSGMNSGTVSEVGWYILGPNQEHVGPYAFSELQGASDDDDDFVKWQDEVREAEVEAEALKESAASGAVGGLDEPKHSVGNGTLKDTETDADDRPLTPPDGEEEFTDDDGTTYKWDRGLRAWVPQDDSFLKTEQYGVEDMTFLKEEEVLPAIKAAETAIEEEMNAIAEKVQAYISCCIRR